MVCPLARVIGVGIETADMLVQEVLSRTMRDRRGCTTVPGPAAEFINGQTR
jgi:transposase